MTEEIRTVVDKLAILEVIAAYGYTNDDNDPVGFANLFTEDGVWEAYEPGTATVPARRLVSRDVIRSRVKHVWDRRAADGVQARHVHTGTVFLDLTAETARTRTVVVLLHRGPEDTAPRAMISGVWLHQWRRTPSGWRIEHVAFHQD